MVLEEDNKSVDLVLLEHDHGAVVNVRLKSCVGEVSFRQRESGQVQVVCGFSDLDLKRRWPRIGTLVLSTSQQHIVALT